MSLPRAGRAAFGLPARPLPRLPAAGAFLRELLPLAALAAAALLLYRDAVLAGSVFYEDDTTIFYYPLARWFSAELAQGHLPRWLPNVFGGYPILADGEVGMLYPPQLLALGLLSPAEALIALRIGHTALAAAGAFALGRALGQSRAGSLACGAVWAFGSFNATQMHHENVVRTAAWLPLLLAFAELACRAEGRRRWRLATAAAVVLGLSALAVHVQPVLLALLALAGLLLFHAVVPPTGVVLTAPRALARRLAEQLALLGAIVGLGLGLAGAQWVPLFELSRMSFRAGGLKYDFATAFALSPEQLVELVFPYFFRAADGVWWTLWGWWETELYVGVPTLALALLGTLLARRRAALFFALLAVAALLVALADRAPVNLHALLWQVPGYSGLRAPGRYLELFVLAMGVLAGYGVDAVARGTAPRLVGLAGRVALGLALALGILLLGLHLLGALNPEQILSLAQEHYVAQRHERPDLTAEQVVAGLAWATSPANPKTDLGVLLLVATGALLLGRPRLDRPGLWPWLASGLVLGDLLLFAYDLHPQAPLAALDPPASFGAALGPSAAHRVLTDPQALATRPDRLVVLDVEDVSGYASLETQRHFDYWLAATARLDTLLDLWGVDRLVVQAPPAGEPQSALAQAVAHQPPGRFQPVSTLDGAEVLANPRAFPRAFVVGHPLYRATRQEPTALERMAGPEFDPQRDVVLEEGPPPPAEPIQAASFAPAIVRRLGSDSMEVHAALEAPGYLVVTESYHRGWTATVDGRSAPVYLADYLFLAVPLPAGEHVVELRFAPLSLWVGAATSLLAAVALAALFAGWPMALAGRAIQRLWRRSE